MRVNFQSWAHRSCRCCFCRRPRRAFPHGAASVSDGVSAAGSATAEILGRASAGFDKKSEFVRMGSLPLRGPVSDIAHGITKRQKKALEKREKELFCNLVISATLSTAMEKREGSAAGLRRKGKEEERGFLK